MRERFFAACCSFFLGVPLFGQAAETKPAFEVASLKRSADPSAHGMMRGGPGSDDPTRVVFRNAPLTLVLNAACGLRNTEISGPDWFDTEPFDIEAKIPPGATKDQYAQMMLNLLVDRFKMTIHHRTERSDGYTMAVARNGLKLKEVKPGDAPSPPTPGFPELYGGRTAGFSVRNMGGKWQVTARDQAIGGLLSILQTQLGADVLNETGLAGKYDFELEYAPPRGPRPPDLGDEVPDIYGALDRVGLKLTKATASIDVLVIDRAEKTPIEN